MVVLGIVPETGKYFSDHPAGDFGPVTVPKEQYFLVGDNLPNSLDSRLLDSWKPGFTPTKLICTNTCFRLHGFRGRDCGVCDVPFRQATQTGATMISVAIIMWCVTFPLVVFYAVRLKTVFANETGLRIRGFVTEIEIPFSEMASVRHNWFFKNDTLFLNARSAFGYRILFIARRRVVTEGGSISTLDMLRNLIN